MRICLRLLITATVLLAANTLHAQGRGGDDNNKPVNNTETIHYACTADGVQRISDAYSGSAYTDNSPKIKYILPIEGARARGEWNEVERLAQMSIKSAPYCYTPYFNHAQYLMRQCKLPEAKTALIDFLTRVNTDPTYAPLITLAKAAQEQLESGRDPSGCTAPPAK
ncbi:hypothetical protein Terro_3319 [Terriglobus roseus DSM 18391]|uniref:Uncharacterized protein n=1 Tax=Terriglobus roseus (strain DSM 18391 / NRRL B-41598 / KBS 63) TaxID=926566 RepID=I3ZJW8_TERRK|nr:hypothetical protein [Terriglobus roseus]AFL89536.1 hypothetical protein Terro_3319 [Terriglobus roseus DSM 18391]